jgi:hypothetical protein
MILKWLRGLNIGSPISKVFHTFALNLFVWSCGQQKSREYTFYHTFYLTLYLESCDELGQAYRLQQLLAVWILSTVLMDVLKYTCHLVQAPSKSYQDYSQMLTQINSSLLAAGYVHLNLMRSLIHFCYLAKQLSFFNFIQIYWLKL